MIGRKKVGSHDRRGAQTETLLMEIQMMIRTVTMATELGGAVVAMILLAATVDLESLRRKRETNAKAVNCPVTLPSVSLG